MPPSAFPRDLLLYVLFFVSGAAALIYQVLWVRELGLLFGSTAEAAALTIAIFFAGIASGGWFWGSRAARLRSSLRGFGLLEIGVAVTALGHFLVADVYFALYPELYALVGAAPVLETLLKAAVAATILLPSAFLMGGTLPLMGQHVIRAGARLGTGGSALYAVNTLGGATGALASGFVLPMALGFKGAYLLAVGLDLAVGIIAVLVARGRLEDAAAVVAARTLPALRLPPLVWTIAFVSGFVTLAVEVLWTRLFAQVLQNSVYTYALVLVTFLLALALGAVLANLLSRQRRVPAETVTVVLLVLSAAIVAATPWLFHTLTGGLGYLGHGRPFWGYVGAVAWTAALAMLLPGIILGAVLPYLLRLLERGCGAPGEALGRLVAVNTTGAILGALAAGFLLIPAFGIWRALWLLAALYALVAGVALIAQLPRPALRGAAGLATAAAVLLLAILPPETLPVIRVNPERGERLVEMREGRAAHAAVIERGGNLSIRVNNYYTLGGTGALVAERNQTLIPLLTHPAPRNVFFLGMGTGITAGAALFLPIERVVVCEILGEVVDLAKAHFGPYANGLFDDPRVVIHAEDGRHCLSRSLQRYDAIIADLFTPWKAGTGNLYTKDHYALAAERLNPGGLYVQWIPLYQVSMQELSIIAATMAAVFPEVTLWRGDLHASRSIVALVGRNEAAPLDPAAVVRQARRVAADQRRTDVDLAATVLRLYAGNVQASGLFADAPVNTDDRPLIEYLAPRTHRAVLTGEASWVVGEVRDQLYADLLATVPPEVDPYLAALDPGLRDLAEAGRLYARYRGLLERGRERAASAHWHAYSALVPESARRPDSPAGRLVPTLTVFGSEEG